MVDLLRSLKPKDNGWYIGNSYHGHDFVGHADSDGPAYEAMHGHRKMPPVMKGGAWIVDRTVDPKAVLTL